LFEKQLYNVLANLVDGLANARKWRMQIFGHGHVVVTGDGNVPANLKAGGHGRVHGPNGDLIANAYHGRGATVGW
jgi:hypothetical protein